MKIERRIEIDEEFASMELAVENLRYSSAIIGYEKFDKDGSKLREVMLLFADMANSHWKRISKILARVDVSNEERNATKTHFEKCFSGWRRQILNDYYYITNN